ncbi:MAG: CHC2 zinc finger domain-containing protein [Ignavibacteriaceae bacterium]|nr:CHC2 zinc finger domain-containing protein [Ignavibacteriaceae bacterium]
MNLIDEIKSRINIVDLAVQLGLEPTKNDFIYSVFKTEKNRSMKLYRKTNTFFDYSTGTQGDVINLYAAEKKISNEEAIKILAGELGIYSNYKIARLQDCKIDESKKKEDQK